LVMPHAVLISKRSWNVFDSQHGRSRTWNPNEANDSVEGVKLRSMQMLSKR